jgi:hypothetical protein
MWRWPFDALCQDEDDDGRSGTTGRTGLYAEVLTRHPRHDGDMDHVTWLLYKPLDFLSYVITLSRITTITFEGSFTFGGIC